MTYPAAVFFDWDGTLVDSYGVLEAAHNHTRKALGFDPLPERAFASYFGKPRDLLYNALYPGKFAEAKAEFETFYRANHLQGIRILPGVPEFLEALDSMGIPMGVVTNKKGDFIREEINHLGWADYFRATVGAGDAGEDKPSPKPLLLAIERAKVLAPARDIWMVGDTENDLLCATGAGCIGILVASADEQKKVLPLAEATYTFKNCGELQEFLLQSRKKEIKGNHI